MHRSLNLCSFARFELIIGRSQCVDREKWMIEHVSHLICERVEKSKGATALIYWKLTWTEEVQCPSRL